MTIDVLPPSPNGELSHGDVREKINEVITTLNGLPTGDNLTGGWGNYVNGDTTPITLPDGVLTKLPLTTSGGSEVETYMPLGVSGLWDSTNSQFDFSSLAIGDMVDIRLDGSLTTTTLNDSFAVILRAAIGTPGQFDLPFASGNRFVAGSNSVSRYNGIFIGSDDIRLNPAELYGLSVGGDSNGFLIDIYVKVLRRGVGANP